MVEVRLLNEKATLQKKIKNDIRRSSASKAKVAISLPPPFLEFGYRGTTNRREGKYASTKRKLNVYVVKSRWGMEREKKNELFFYRKTLKTMKKLPLHELVQPAEALPGLPLQLAAGPAHGVTRHGHPEVLRPRPDARVDAPEGLGRRRRLRAAAALLAAVAVLKLEKIRSWEMKVNKIRCFIKLAE